MRVKWLRRITHLQPPMMLGAHRKLTLLLRISQTHGANLPLKLKFNPFKIVGDLL